MEKTIIYIFEKIRRNGFSFEFRILDVKFLGVVTYFVPFDKPGYLEVVFSSLDFINILENCPIILPLSIFFQRTFATFKVKVHFTQSEIRKTAEFSTYFESVW